MSDYERKINANDIRAYEDKSTAIHSKIIGVVENGHIHSRNQNLKARYTEGVLKPVFNGYTELINPLEVSRASREHIPRPTIFKGTSKLAEIASNNLHDQSRRYIHNNNYGVVNKSIENIDAGRYRMSKKRDATPDINSFMRRINENSFPNFNPHKDSDTPRQDITQMKPAGGLRRQVINYNIINGVDI